jgi:hypothetical protein
VNSSTATLTYAHVTADDISAIAPNDSAAPQTWSLVVQLAGGCGTTTLLRIVSTLHLRHAHVSQMRFTADPDGAGVLTIECTTVLANIETVRKSIERVVDVLSATAHETPSQNGHSPRDAPGGSRAK